LHFLYRTTVPFPDVFNGLEWYLAVKIVLQHPLADEDTISPVRVKMAQSDAVTMTT
jgi:hypothetical protein